MFKKLLSLDEAKSKIERNFPAKPLSTETIDLLEAAGRTLAEDIPSPINVPPFDRSTVDGYAVRARDTFGAEEHSPIALRLVGSIEVGKKANLRLKKKETLQIVTGAPLPINADAVAMVENTTKEDDTILLYQPVATRENVMLKGSDLQKGDIALASGKTLSSADLGVLAALGFVSVTVHKQPNVAVISTGAEIVQPGRSLKPGEIYDINTYTLSAAVKECGGKAISFGIVQDDDIELLRSTLKKALKETDVVITSGGVSVGPKDVLPKILTELGKPGLVVHGVAVKPGKPVAVAILSGKPVFSLPGNPTSALLMFHLIARPFLCRMAARIEKPSISVEATIVDKVFSARGRRTFVTVTLSRDEEGRLLAHPIPHGQSGAITTLAHAVGYVELSENEQFKEAGQKVRVVLLRESPEILAI